MENIKVNNGNLFEALKIRQSFGSEKSSDICYDYLTVSGLKVECKFFTVKPADDYKQKKAVINSAHAHQWVRNGNGDIDYLLTVEKFARESDVLKVGIGTDWDNCIVYTFKSYKKRFAFYFCRLQWQKGEPNGRLCVNPISTKAGGRERQLNTLRENGVVNVPTFAEVEQMFKSVFGE